MSTNPFRLPAYVENKAPDVIAKWQHVYQQYGGAQDDNRGMIAANSWLQHHVASQPVRQWIQFEIDTSKEFISATDSGEEYINAVLTDRFPDSDGDSWSESEMRMFADQVNNEFQPVGDVDHQEYDALMRAGLTDDEVIAKLREKKGIAKAVKAVVQDGRLWLRLMFDKRYKNVIKNAKGLSLEALRLRDNSGQVTGAKLLGFTFGVNHIPRNSRAIVYD